MKTVIGLLLLSAALSSCSPIATFRNSVMGNKGMSSEDKKAYAEKVEEFNHMIETKKAQFKEFRIYHFAAISLLVIGGVQVFIMRAYVLGVGAFLTGFIVSGWAMYAPTHENFVGWFLGGMIALSIAFIIWRTIFLTRQKVRRKAIS